MPQGLDVHPRLIANFSSMSRKLRSEKREKIDKDSEICLVVKGRRESGVVGFTDTVKRRGGMGSAKGIDKGRNVGLAWKNWGDCSPTLAIANLASEGKVEAVDDTQDINRNQGGRCCLGKSSREGEKKKRNIAVDKRKMATGKGENEKNV